MAILVLVLLEVLRQDEPPTVHELRWAVCERVADDDVFYDGCGDKMFRQHLGRSRTTATVLSATSAATAPAATANCSAGPTSR